MAKSLFMRLTVISTCRALGRTITFLIILSSFADRSAAATAPTPPMAPSQGTTNFDDAFPGLTVLINAQPSPQTAANVGTLVATGWDFTATAPTDNVSISAQAGGPTAVASDLYMRLNRQTSGKTLTIGGVKSNDGSPFSLQSFYLRIGASATADIIITGYRSGVAVTGATTTLALANNVWTLITLSTILSGGLPAYRAVDEFRVTQAGTTTAQIGNFSIDAITIATAVLPLTLTDFSGHREGNDVLLNWTTATEQNTGSFEIQRGIDGATYMPAGTTTAAGNSSQPLHYSYTDHPSFAASPYFYRLKMADLDGKFTYSSILRIGATQSGLSLSAYPNPFHGQVSILVDAPHADKASVTIRDMSGKILQTQNTILQKGTNILPLPVFTQLGSGAYLLTISTRQHQQSVTVLKTD